ncbi:BTB/POZ protein [Whalleya microplaca]|nr:BTB/POZ protein [Whalleya microplaca]
MARGKATASGYTTTAIMLSKSGEDLLESGKFSDVTVKCADRTWNLHKSVICIRCPFFEKAFNGEFEEMKTGELTVHDWASYEVDWVIKFLYTGQVPKEFLEVHSIHACINLFKIADFFQVPSLQDRAVKMVRCEFETIAQNIRVAADSYLNNPAKSFTEDELNDFLYVAETAYDTGSASYTVLQDLVKYFLDITRFHIGKDIRFNTVLEKVPKMAVDMVKLLMRAENKGSMSAVVTQTQTPKNYIICKRDGIICKKDLHLAAYM